MVFGRGIISDENTDLITDANMKQTFSEIRNHISAGMSEQPVFPISQLTKNRKSNRNTDSTDVSGLSQMSWIKKAASRNQIRANCLYSRRPGFTFYIFRNVSSKNQHLSHYFWAGKIRVSEDVQSQNLYYQLSDKIIFLNFFPEYGLQDSASSQI